MWWYIVLCLFIYRVYVWWRHRPWLEELDTKCVFITGCDSGFGKSAAKSLYRRGVTVFAGCLTERGAHQLRQETSDGIHTIDIDVSDTKSIERAYKQVCEKLPPGSGNRYVTKGLREI